MNWEQIIKIHKVISDPVRWDILEYLKFHYNQTVDDLIKYFNIDQSTLSFHMKKMKEVNLITIEKNGKFIIYNPNFKTLEQIYEFMGSVVDIAKSNKKPYIFTKQILQETYAAYADPIRVKLFKLILENQSISGKQLKILSKVSEANIVFHTKKLEDVHIISSKKIGNQRYYWPNITFLMSFHDFIAETRNKNFWHDK